MRLTPTPMPPRRPTVWPRRLLSALLALAGCGTASAQTVSVYGIADQAVEVLSNAAPAGGRLFRMPTLTGSVPSRLGLRGSEDLGGGMKALFALESGIALDSGALGNGGRAWGRHAYVALAGSWGQLSLGRLPSATFVAGALEPLGGNLYSNASLDSYIPNARSDNSLSLQTQFAGTTLLATYSLGRDTVNGAGPAATNCPGENASDRGACRQWSLLARHDGQGFGLAVALDRQHGGSGATLGLGSSDYSDTRTSVYVYTMLGQTRVTAGLIDRRRRSAEQLDSRLLFAGFSHPLSTQLTLDAQYSRLDIRQNGNDAAMLAARLSYAFSKRSTVYAMAGRMGNEGSSALSLSAGGSVVAGQSQAGLALGLRHAF